MATTRGEINPKPHPLLRPIWRALGECDTLAGGDARLGPIIGEACDALLAVNRALVAFTIEAQNNRERIAHYQEAE